MEFDGKSETDHTFCLICNQICLRGHFCYRISSEISFFVFFSFQNNPKDLDPSFKMDLDLWDCLGRVKLVLQQNFIGLILLIVVILERGKPCLIAR